MIELKKQYDKLQTQYGDPNLNCIYGGGQEHNPKLCLVFMNPTKRNITANKDWNGIRTPWLGTKEIWKFLTKCGVFPESLTQEIITKKSQDWTPEFCKTVYTEVVKNGLFITNLAKCTQSDARHLPDSVYSAYLSLFLREMEVLNPQTIILFGNQVSSLVLNQKIEVSKVREQKFTLSINGKSVPVYSMFYPVGNGRFNAHKAVEDLLKIIKE